MPARGLDLSMIIMDQRYNNTTRYGRYVSVNDSIGEFGWLGLKALHVDDDGARDRRDLELCGSSYVTARCNGDGYRAGDGRYDKAVVQRVGSCDRLGAGFNYCC